MGTEARRPTGHGRKAESPSPGATGGLSASANGGDDEQEPTILSCRSISHNRLRGHTGIQNVNDSVALVGKLPVAPGGLPAGSPTLHSYYVPLRNQMRTGVPFNSQGVVRFEDIRPR